MMSSSLKTKPKAALDSCRTSCEIDDLASGYITIFDRQIIMFIIYKWAIFHSYDNKGVSLTEANQITGFRNWIVGSSGFQSSTQCICLGANGVEKSAHMRFDHHVVWFKDIPGRCGFTSLKTRSLVEHEWCNVQATASAWFLSMQPSCWSIQVTPLSNSTNYRFYQYLNGNSRILQWRYCTI